MSAALHPVASSPCHVVRELSADGCGGPANWVAERRGAELDSGNAIENVGATAQRRMHLCQT